MEYHVSVPEVEKFYKSSGYKDELVWAGLWLYRATGKYSYYETAKRRYYAWRFFSSSAASEFSWDNKIIGAQLLFAQVTRGDLRNGYIKPVITYCRKPDANPNVKFTKKKLLFVNDWAPLRYAANSALICAMASEYTSSELPIKFAKEQAAYILGENGFGGSFVVGFGEKYPLRPHHRASSCPQMPAQCGKSFLTTNNINPHILFVSPPFLLLPITKK